jgi:hypothetical protein
MWPCCAIFSVPGAWTETSWALFLYLLNERGGSLSDSDGYYIEKCVLTHTVRTHVQHFIRRRIIEDVMTPNRALVLVFGGQIGL